MTFLRNKHIREMDNTFFGFDSTVPFEDNGVDGQIAEPPEEEYDALNDETFGSAINGDWEAAHENMLRLTDCTTSKSFHPEVDIFCSQMYKTEEADLDLNLAEMRLDDVELSFNDDKNIAESNKVHLDPSVWASGPCKFTQRNKSNLFELNHTSCYRESTNQFLEQKCDQQSYQTHKAKDFKLKFPGTTHGARNTPRTPKFCTLEDIERNIIIEQTLRTHFEQQSTSDKQRYSQEQIKHIPFSNNSMKQVSMAAQMQTTQQQKEIHLPQLKSTGSSHTVGELVKPTSTIANKLTQNPLGNLLNQQTCGVGSNHLLSGLNLYSTGLGSPLAQHNNYQVSQHPLLNQPGISGNLHKLSQRTLTGAHLPIALNNFVMHPNFNAMRAVPAVGGIHQPTQPHNPSRINSHPHSKASLLNTQQPNTMYNMFNTRLLQEIQQNHPLLQSTPRQHAHQYVGPNIAQNLGQHHHRTSSSVNVMSVNQHRDGRSNGNLPKEDFDEYANLMSTRDKHWLIGIQLSQLNTDTPYIDDFYYTVYREKSLVKNGNLYHSQAHKDNQLNHPLTQPKGHAQLILVQLGNKNGSRNGQHRERYNSETNMVIDNNDQKMPYVFTPLKFENSLGKLQYGSVTAPRKIIDAEIMGNDSVSTVNGDIKRNIATIRDSNSASVKSSTSIPSITTNVIDNALSAQQKARHILLQIEKLYRIVLKLEDLSNPTAIKTIILKNKKENERIAVLQQLDKMNNFIEDRDTETLLKAAKEATTKDALNKSKMNAALEHNFTYQIEKKENLITKLTGSLTPEEVSAIMSVRKGKTLMRRIMPHIEDHEVRWNIWIGIFTSLQNVVRKDKDDADGILYALYPEFKNQIRQANFELVLKISSSIHFREKKCNGIFCSKFGISSLVCLVLQAENIYVSGTDSTHNDSNKENWRNFLKKVATSLDRTIQNQTVCAEIDTDSIQPLMNHVARFQDLKLDSLLALIVQAKQQLN